jgi:hypothetical protein
MKKYVFLSLCVFFLTSCDFISNTKSDFINNTKSDFISNTEFVKQSFLDFDQSSTIGEVLDNYRYFTNTEWEEFITDQGKEIVEFKGYYTDDFDNDLVVRIQFRMNRDRRIDDEGHAFNIAYVGRTYYQGSTTESSCSNCLSKIYKNAML